MFTYHYQQPDEYHFSLDSIHFAEFVASHLDKTNLEMLRVLDLCAGCGVIGLELSWYLRDLRHFDFIEVQDIYTKYFHQNIAVVNRPELQVNWHILNYDALIEKSWTAKYDLIVSNPPYFQAGQGVLSPVTFKNRCRFFLDSSFENYILALDNLLASGGKAYFLMRPLMQHGSDLFSEAQELLHNKSSTLTRIARIRGTDIILMEK